MAKTDTNYISEISLLFIIGIFILDYIYIFRKKSLKENYQLYSALQQLLEKRKASE